MPSVSHSISAQEDNGNEVQDCNDDEDQQQCHHDSHPNIAIFGRVDESEALTSEAIGNGESLQISSSVEENIQNDTAIQDGSQTSETIAIQEESETGSSKPQERVVSKGGLPAHTEVVTGEYIKLGLYICVKVCISTEVLACAISM